MSNLFVDVRQDVVYTYGWPSRVFWAIRKVKRAPERAYAHFDDFRMLLHTIFWVIGIPTLKMPNLFVDVRQDIVYAYGWPSRLFWAIWKVKRAPERAYASF